MRAVVKTILPRSGKLGRPWSWQATNLWRLKIGVEKQVAGGQKRLVHTAQKMDNISFFGGGDHGLCRLFLQTRFFCGFSQRVCASTSMDSTVRSFLIPKQNFCPERRLSDAKMGRTPHYFACVVSVPFRCQTLNAKRPCLQNEDTTRLQQSKTTQKVCTTSQRKSRMEEGRIFRKKNNIRFASWEEFDGFAGFARTCVIYRCLRRCVARIQRRAAVVFASTTSDQVRVRMRLQIYILSELFLCFVSMCQINQV